MRKKSGETHRVISRPQFTVRHTAASACEFQPHCHHGYTVTTLLAGRLDATIGPADVVVGEGESALTNIGETHSGRATGVAFLSVCVAPGLVHELAAELGLIWGGTHILFRSPVVNDQALVAIARAMTGEMEDERVGQAPMLEAMARQLCVHLLRHHLTVRKSPQIEASRAGPVDRRLRRALEFIHDNYSAELDLAQMAEAAYMSEYHFARLFKRIIGLSPHAYLANLRIERARELLLQTSQPINDVAAAVGYQSQSHFTKVFKAVTGLTPRVYRNGWRGPR